jgi:N-acetylmuramate 1-kinase
MASSLSQQKSRATWRIALPDEAQTAILAVEIARWLKPGDMLTLSGELGAGKTAFARALIRELTDTADLDVPSPTFTLMQIYDGRDFPIVHADLYRIRDPEELEELGWDEAAEGALVLVEWPDRAGARLPPDRLDVCLALDATRDAGFRVASLTGYGAFAARLEIARAVHHVLADAGFADAERHYMQGDASTRSYERLVRPDGATAILMISPSRPDGPPIRFGKSYGTLAHLAENIRPFVAIDKGLRAEGFSAPEIYAVDLDVGVAVLEDFGSDGIVHDGEIVLARYAESVALLARLHQMSLPESLPVDDAREYHIPPYDIDALAIEIELLLDWYAPHIAKASLTSGAKASFVNLWRHALREVVSAPWTWTLRDFHSPNILWIDERQGNARVGLIDFQDCVLGHPAYDVVSLLQDARVSLPPEAELKLLGHYAQLRRIADANFDMASFARAYAVLGAQRATKILGIFARLDKRDRKPHYLAHLPRVEENLAKDLAHPLLSGLKGWYETHLPRLFTRGA